MREINYPKAKCHIIADNSMALNGEINDGFRNLFEWVSSRVKAFLMN